jgi:predicted ATPase
MIGAGKSFKSYNFSLKTMNIKKISIKNFRVFKEKTTFQLRPFTILTGPNNSGKSSFIKFLLLIKEGVRNLNFTSGNHNLEDFNQVLNFENKENGKEELKFRLFFDNNQEIEYSYIGDSSLIAVSHFKNNKRYLDFAFGEDYSNINTATDIGYREAVRFYFDFNSFIQRLKKRRINGLQRESSLLNKNLSKSNNDNNIDKANKIINRNNNEIETLKESNLLFKIQINNNEGIDYYEKYQQELLELQTDFFSFDKLDSFSYETEDLLKYLESNISKKIHFIVSDLSIKVYDFLKIKIPYLQDWEDINFEINKFGVLILSNSKSITRALVKPLKFNYLKENLFYLSANRGNQKRVLMNRSENDIDEILVNFSKNKTIDKVFLSSCFQILGIEGDIEVNRYENTISTVYLKRGNQKLAFADLGFGYSQILPIILKVHNLVKSYQYIVDIADLTNDHTVSRKFLNQKLLILEEPEANLHPNLQSKLAELLVFIQDKFGLRFIIETHSEYFIRKLQYLTAKEELKKEDSVIYYFNDDKYVSKTEPKVKEIFINEDGGLTDSFGPGFFDEATKLQFDLIRLQKQQFN